jgi:hypothetical protein
MNGVRHRAEVLDFLASVDRGSSLMSAIEVIVDAAADPKTRPTPQRAFQAVKRRVGDPPLPWLTADRPGSMTGSGESESERRPRKETRPRTSGYAWPVN